MKVTLIDVKSDIQTATEVKDSIMPAMQGEDSSQMKIGMCDIYYTSGVEIILTEVKGTIQNPLGTVMLPLCEKCREWIHFKFLPCFVQSSAFPLASYS